MSIDILTGPDAANVGDAEFAGFANPRRYSISESLKMRSVTLLQNAFQGHWGADKQLAEAFATSDFKLASFAQLDYEMQAQYEELPSVWRQYTDTTTVNDFRPKRLIRRGSLSRGMPLVPELTEYPADDNRYADAYAITVAKHGKRKALSWEAWINNEAVGELQDMPSELARDARDTESISAISNLLAVDQKTLFAPGVNTDFFKAGNGNAPTALPLTRENLKTVLDGMKVKKDPVTKRIIAAPELVLVIPKALEAAALRITTPNEIRTTVGSVETVEGNEFKNLRYVVEPMLDYVNTNAKAATTWFLVPVPGSARPALWQAFLRGHETPDLRVKTGAGARTGGGEISPLEGSFELDDIQYRGRHVVGNQTGDALFTYCSLGS